MALGLQTSDGIWDGWGGGFVDTSYDQPRTADTVPTDITTERQAVSQAPVNDQWTDWFKSSIGQVLDYGIKRDAAVTGAELRTQTSQPVYMQAPAQRQAGNGGTLLLIGLAVVAGIALAK